MAQQKILYSHTFEINIAVRLNGAVQQQEKG